MSTLTREIKEPTEDQLQRIKYCLISVLYPVRDCKTIKQVKTIFEKGELLKKLKLQDNEIKLLENFGFNLV